MNPRRYVPLTFPLRGMYASLNKAHSHSRKCWRFQLRQAPLLSRRGQDVELRTRTSKNVDVPGPQQVVQLEVRALAKARV